MTSFYANISVLIGCHLVILTILFFLTKFYIYFIFVSNKQYLTLKLEVDFKKVFKNYVI